MTLDEAGAVVMAYMQANGLERLDIEAIHRPFGMETPRPWYVTLRWPGENPLTHHGHCGEGATLRDALEDAVRRAQG